MLYDEAARILKLVENSGGGARNLTFSSSYSVSVSQFYFFNNTTNNYRFV